MRKKRGIMGKIKSSLPESMNFGNESAANSEQRAEKFNNYFTSVADLLANEIVPGENPFQAYLPDPVPFSFFLSPTSLNEIKDIMKKLKLSSAGHDDMDIRVIKECTDTISPFLVHMINSSFQEGVFPKHLEIARIVLVYKKGDRFDHTNYRPISILSCFSKIFEKVVVASLINYLTQHSLLAKEQF